MLLFLVGLALLSAILYFVYVQAKNWTFWQRHGFPVIETGSILGITGKVLLSQQGLADILRDAHLQLKKRNLKVGGMHLLNEPHLLVADRTVVKHMMQVDFESFSSRGFEVGDPRDPMQDHMFNLDGEEWKLIRRKLSPTFTSGKIKSMLACVEKHVDNLCDVIKKDIKNGQKDFLFAHYLERSGMDIIGETAFGLQCNCLQEGTSEFSKTCGRILNPSPLSLLKLMLKRGLPNLRFLIKLTTADQDVREFFLRIVKDTVEHRVKNNIKVKDFLQMLMEVVDEEGKSLTLIEMVAQSFLFFAAGFETSARTVSFMLFVLVKNKDVQEKLREELRKGLEKENGQYTYNMIMENEYLDLVFKETQRLYPAVIFLNRVCMKDYNIPDTNLVLPKGTSVIFSTLGLQHDPENFKDPLKFDTDRFRKENSDQIKPFTYIPFGDGPRVCIGKRFGSLVSKLEVAKLVMNYDISLSPDQPAPSKISPVTKSIVLELDKPLCLNFRPL